MEWWLSNELSLPSWSLKSREKPDTEQAIMYQEDTVSLKIQHDCLIKLQLNTI